MLPLSYPPSPASQLGGRGVMHRNHKFMLESKMIQQTFRFPSLSLQRGRRRKMKKEKGRKEAEVEILTHVRIGRHLGCLIAVKDEPRKSPSA